MSIFQLHVNGRLHTVDIDGNMPLLWALRDVLGLKGTKFGCGVAQCGACTVHLDGRAVRSCSVDVGVACLSQITTIEGLSYDGSHPCQKAWVELGVPQCGFCQPGQIMSAAALLNATKGADPTDEQIDNAMRGNICRCGTYPRIRKAIHKAAGSSKS
jgi:isoquinoline 1-oxidoreductase alpha subunit